jgi:lysozyme
MKKKFLYLLLCILTVQTCILLKWKLEREEPPLMILEPVELKESAPYALPFQDDAHEKLVRLITECEGFFSEPYVCPAGQKTIGYGFTASCYTKKGRMSESEARLILTEEIIPSTRAIVRKHVKVKLTPYQEAALISFCFNCGESSLKALVCRKGRLNDGNFSVIPSIMKQYTKANGKTLKGLVNRRSQEASLFIGKI